MKTVPLQKEQPMDPKRQHHKNAILRDGLRRAWAGALWMYKIVIPVSLFTFVLSYSRILDYADGILGPVMGVLHLPAKAAMPLIAGILTGIYGGIAAMAVLSFTIKETTLIAVFLLISHALIQESAIQSRSGMGALKATASRLLVASLVVWVMGMVWQGGQQPNALLSIAAPTASQELAPAFGSWCLATLVLCIQILVILVVIMTASAWMQAHHVAERLITFLRPVLKFMGLSENVGLLWLTAILFGISYGGAVIIEEVRKGKLSKQELEHLHVSIGINHAMIEDPALFLPLGIHPLWLWLPRLAAAIIAVHALKIWHRLSDPLFRKMGLISEKPTI
jgi:cytochrome b561